MEDNRVENGSQDVGSISDEVVQNSGGGVDAEVQGLATGVTREVLAEVGPKAMPAIGRPGYEGRGWLIPGYKGHRAAGGKVLDEQAEILGKGTPLSVLRRIVLDDRVVPRRRLAAFNILKALEMPDAADYEPWLNGTKTLAELREEGISTISIKKAVTRRIPQKGGGEPIIERELVLHDRSDKNFATLMDRLAGLPVAVNITEGDLPAQVTINVPAWPDELTASRARPASVLPGDEEDLSRMRQAEQQPQKKEEARAAEEAKPTPPPSTPSR